MPIVSAGELVSHIGQLRSAVKKARDPEVRELLRNLEAALRKTLGPSVPKSVAARALGVSVTALDRWIDRGRVPVVAKAASARLEVETGPFLELADCVSSLRARGNLRPLAGAFRLLGRPDDPHGRQVVAEEIARLPRPNVSARELRDQFARTTPEERVRQAAELSRSLTTPRAGPA